MAARLKSCPDGEQAGLLFKPEVGRQQDDVDRGGAGEYILAQRPLHRRVRAEAVMRLLNFTKAFLRGIKNVYEKVAAQGKSRLAHRSKPTDMPSVFDSGMSVVGDWILDLSVLALIALVLGNVMKWAYVAIFHR